MLAEQPRTVSPPAANGQRLRVLVGAYTLSPARGSEPGVGWGICHALAQHHDLTILCAKGMPGGQETAFETEINAYIAKHGPIPGMTFHYVPRPKLSQWFQKERELFRRTVYYMGYKRWQKSALAEARRLHAEKPFDIAHQLNITGFREPGYLWKLPIPFVWGPIGGGANIPFAYFPIMGWMDRIFYTIRNLTNEVQKRTVFRCRRAAAAARHLWTVGHQSTRMVEQIWGYPSEVLLEMGCMPRPDARTRERDPSRPLRIVWSALHIGRKALPILLRAMQTLGPDAPVELAVLGSGPLTDQWKAEAERLGLGKKVRFTGGLPLQGALDEVRRADVMAFTSIQEGTPAAVLEALSLGVPLICHDACGMGVAVDQRCGIKVPMVSISESVAGFAAALRRLIDEQDLLGRLSAGALVRSQELNWEHIGRRIARVYQEIAAGKSR
ncbi:glycosyltransferase family 4 protein [Humisphaera borealis]|uniref:Glycosyltransferase n=1 Tax=Humisphaera borealis TaxID=2807512 RepID=A0A7M2WTH5_9BACT|nr:glycosyltransferase [Humisphaera borealis]QOV88818.1 glycosyltransferase [Humisphaera borealis]